jgi:drug/metabolite transporter (DMT)-like permease
MPLTAYRLLLSLLAFIGLALVLAVDFSRLSAVGLLLSASSALFSAVLVISMVRLSKDVGGLTTTFQLSIWSMIVALGGMAAAGEARLPVNTLGWLGIVGSAVAFLVGFVAFLEAAKRIGATRASIFSFTEPIGAILIAAAMYGEQMTATQWIGTLIVAGCLFLLEAPAAFAGRPQQSTTS